jgi:hypothetical protein
VVLNDVVTSATMDPGTPSSGQTFNLDNYQTVVNLPSSLASAAAAVSSSLAGSATAQVDASGATPATTSVGPLNFNLPFPSPIPDAGVTLSLPSTPQTVGPFTATSTAITMQEDSAASLSLEVAGSALTLTCTAYPDNSVTPSGITTSAPSVPSIAPVLAVAGGGSTTTTAPTTTTTTPTKPSTTTTTSSGGGGGSTTPTTAKVVTAPASSLAFTGVGPGVGVLGIVGGALILLGFALLVLVDAPRRALAQFAALGPSGWRRMRQGAVTERLGSLNPMRLRRTRNEGVPVTTITESSRPDEVASAEGVSTRVRGPGDRFSRMEATGRELAQSTARTAVRTAQWLLGR